MVYGRHQGYCDENAAPHPKCKVEEDNRSGVKNNEYKLESVMIRFPFICSLVILSSWISIYSLHIQLIWMLKKKKLRIFLSLVQYHVNPPYSIMFSFFVCWKIAVDIQKMSNNENYRTLKTWYSIPLCP